jgi:preprotein translocase subunit SecG
MTHLINISLLGIVLLILIVILISRNESRSGKTGSTESGDREVDQ